MPCPHYRISIISRGKNQSAVAAAAYQSGDRLFSERDHRTKYYGRKEGIVYTEILLPAHAPPEFSDRNILWNSVEEVEPNWNSQLARRVVLTLPRELSIEENIKLVREHCQREFVSRGMVADIGVHDPDPPGSNPHAHIMLTMRPLNEQGQWMAKSRKVYDLDEDGNRIRNEKGKWKTHKEFTTNRDGRANAENWRHEWEVIQNQYLEAAGRHERVSLKSFERQGVDRIPEVHMGPAVSAMERKGIHTDIGDLNRDIRRTNRWIASLKQKINRLTTWIREVKEAIAEIEMEPEEILLVDLMIQKFDERRAERYAAWENPAGMKKADVMDLQRFARITDYMRTEKILTVEELESRMGQIQEMAVPLRDRMKQIDKRMKEIDTIKSAYERFKELQPVHDQYLKIHWKARQKKYAEQHKAEIEEWKKCDRYLRVKLPYRKYRPKAMAREQAELLEEKSSLAVQLSPVQEEVDMMKDIKNLVKDLLPELQPEGKIMTPERKEKKRLSMKERLARAGEKAQAYNEGRYNGWKEKSQKEQDQLF